MDAFKIFDAIVKTILWFGTDKWGYKYYNVIQQVHVQFCKRLCNLSQNTPDSLALGECGRYPLAIIYMSQCIKYWTKLIVLSNYRYPKHCYTMLKQLDECRGIIWATHIKTIIFEHGFGYI